MTNVLSQKWLTVCLSIGIVIALAAGYWLRQKREKDYVFVELRAFPTASGWGYDILQNKEVYIHQDIIPVIGGKRCFQTKEQALAIGKRVLDRLSRKQIPDVTLQDLQEVGIDTIQIKNP